MRASSPAGPNRPPARGALLLVGALLASGPPLAPASAQAQEHHRSLATYGEQRRTAPIVQGLPEVPGGFTLCRLQYTVARNLRSGLGWSTDYPGGEYNLATRLTELSTTWISRWRNDDPGIAVVRPTDPELFECPMLLMSDPGSVAFSPEDVSALREYFLKGGMLWADDFWGTRPWGFWEAEIRRILPDHPIEEVPMDHPLLSIVYHVPEIPQIPNLSFWRNSGGQTSEFGSDSENATMRAIIDDDGRILVLMTHNTDIADGWEREMDNDEYFLLFSPDAYAIGINVLVWSMTH